MLKRISNALRRRSKSSENLTSGMGADQEETTLPRLSDTRGHSLDTDDGHFESKRSLGASFKRKSLRRRPSKREKPEEKSFGNSPEVYEEICARVLQEKAVVNAVEALQERWQMIMFMYHDCVDLNQGRLERQQMKLEVKRQIELIELFLFFCLLCLPVAGVMTLLVLAFR